MNGLAEASDRLDEKDDSRQRQAHSRHTHFKAEIRPRVVEEPANLSTPI
jgi:hypothetical protein